MPRHITEYILYRWRYRLGYIAVGLLVTILLVAAVFYVPGGLSNAEMQSAVNSSQLTFTAFDPVSIIDSPYKLLQHASFWLLGVTTVSVKLPSLILALLSLVGIIMLLRHWFHTNVAVISALIIITTSQFIFSSQDGTPTIMYIFLPTWLLLLALKVSRQDQRQKKRQNFWEILIVAALALSLYTPLSVYIIVALASATLLHPHLRFIVGRLSRRKLLVAGVMGIAILAPLLLAIFKRPDIGLILLGIPEAGVDIKASGIELFKTYLGFILPNASRLDMQPVYTLPSLLLVAMGVIHLFKTKYTARSYIISSWLILLAPVILINPSKTTITFVPVMLLIAAGIDELLHRWYSMFPRNPYARVAGLFPITLLVIGMALTGTERYFYAYRYNPAVARNFSDDLALLETELKSLEGQSTVLMTTETELPFYRAVADHTDNLAVATIDQPLPESQPLIVTKGAFEERNMEQKEPSKIITNGKRENSDRLYLYKNTAE